MTTLGKTSDGAGFSGSSAAKTSVSSATAGASGVVSAGHFRAWLTSATGATVVNVVIYADSSGAPGALLATSDNFSVTGTTDVQNDVTFSGANQINIVNGTTYWGGLAWPAPTGGGTLNLSRDATAAGRQESSTQHPDPFGTPTSLTGPVAVFVDFAPATTSTAGSFFLSF